MNRFRLLGDYLRSAPRLTGMPAGLCVETTNRCNMSCVMCPRGALDSQPGDMPFEFFKRIADEASGYVEFISFSFRGEPLLNRNLFQMVRYAKELGMRTSVLTNGMLLDEATGKELIESGLDLLSISIDAASQKVYNKIRCGGDFYRVIENTKRMIDLNKKAKQPMMIVAQMIRMEENLSEVQPFKAYWKRKSHVFPKIKPFSTRTGLIDNAILRLRKERPVRCSRMWRGMYVCADGTVVPCCNDYRCREQLGNLTSQSIKEIWNSESFVNLRRLHCEGKFEAVPICRGCEFLKTNFHKQLATFVFDDLVVRKLLAIFDLNY